MTGPRRPRTGPSRALVPAAVVVVAAGLGFLLARALPTRAEVASWAEGRSLPDLSAIDAPLRAAATEAGVDADLLRGLVAAESSGDPKARSGAGAVGLTQLLPSTAAEQAVPLGLDPARLDLEDPATNLRLGARYLRRLLAQFDGEEAFAIAAYNAGAEPVKRWRMRAPDAPAAEVIRREAYPETRNHVDRVLRYRDAFRGRG
ncbi:MAG: lytic transglycosylase domain-containing protein [Planctomycetota bacterium]